MWELKRRVRERIRAWITCGVMEGDKKGDEGGRSSFGVRGFGFVWFGEAGF